MKAGEVIDGDWFPRPLPHNLQLGDNPWIFSAFAFIHCRSGRLHGIKIGRSSGIYLSSFFELGPSGEVSIGDYTTIVAATFAANSRIVIGSYCFIAHDVVLADSHYAKPWTAPAADSPREVPTTIEVGDNVWIGAGATLLAGARIGHAAIVGAASVVDFAVPSYAIVAGDPARVVGYVDADDGVDANIGPLPQEHRR